ncbi:MAG: carboxypeptidase-like regulatory domain-containing protein, partial [Fulvivirga sp.]|nr:carboxypeptidase-like regulatory domain-containing protein [Fulvivirga sp.]
MKRLTIMAQVILFLLCLNRVYAQQMVTGKVVDANDQQPVASALVKAVDGTSAIVTNQQGEFTLTIDDAVTQLMVSHVSYEKKVVPVKKELFIELIPVSLEEVIIQGVRAAADDPVTQSTVARKEIQKAYNGEQP